MQHPTLCFLKHECSNHPAGGLGNGGPDLLLLRWTEQPVCRRALQAIADLERRVIDADGARLKLEGGELRGRTGDCVKDLLWWEADRLLGFLGLYGIGSSVEVAGMVAPDARRRGIATGLLDAALALRRARAYREVLLIVPPIRGRHLFGGCAAAHVGSLLARARSVPRPNQRAGQPVA